MPGFDRTGPEGQGPKTGRGMGKCNNNPRRGNEDSDSSFFRRSLGRRLAGRGFRRNRR